MNRRMGLLALVVALAVVLSAETNFASWWGNSERVRGSGHLTEEVRQIDKVTQVDLATIGVLFIEIGDHVELTIEAEDNLLEYIETNVRHGRLTIDNEDGIQLRPRKAITYHLMVTSLDAIVISSSGDVVIIDDIVSDEFAIEIGSSGDLDIGTIDCTEIEITINSSGDVSIDELNADVLDLSIRSSGDVKIARGQIGEQNIAISSSGDYNARRVASEEARVRISSSGDAHVRVSERLDARTSSSGDINYYGDPKIRRRETSSGDIRRAGG